VFVELVMVFVQKFIALVQSVVMKLIVIIDVLVN
jgi:hypothetical protein